MDFLSDSIMLEMLKKVQPLQVEILKTGRTCHVDAGVGYSSLYDKSHIGFEVVIFEELDLVKDYDFSSVVTEEELNAEFACLQAYVNRIKAE